MRLAVRLMRDKRRIIPSRTVADQAQKDWRDPESRNGASRSYVATLAPPSPNAAAIEAGFRQQTRQAPADVGQLAKAQWSSAINNLL
jgi:hypothetical protein